MGGAETITVNLASSMLKLGHSVKILYLSGEQKVFVPSEIETINLCMEKNLTGFFKALKKAKNVVNAFKPDVVHANMFHAILFSRLLRCIVKYPRLICTEHSNNFHGNVRRIIERITDFLSDLNTNVSEQATEYFIKKGVFTRKKSITVYNGVDLQKFSYKTENSIRKKYGINKDEFVFINVSRFNEAKDHRTLIEAFYRVHKENSNVKLICVGEGELLNSIKKQVLDLGLSNDVIFTGIQYNTPDFYNSSDCFVLSSAWEGFGIVLVEAMGCELEVISTDCGGTREIVQDTNKLVPIKAAEKLAEKMLFVSKCEKEILRKNGKLNREMVMKFDMENILRKWEHLYKND